MKGEPYESLPDDVREFIENVVIPEGRAAARRNAQEIQRQCLTRMRRGMAGVGIRIHQALLENDFGKKIEITELPDTANFHLDYCFRCSDDAGIGEIGRIRFEFKTPEFSIKRSLTGYSAKADEHSGQRKDMLDRTALIVGTAQADADGALVVSSRKGIRAMKSIPPEESWNEVLEFFSGI